MASYAPGQHPARGSNLTKTHTRKPYSRPESSVPSGIDSQPVYNRKTKFSTSSAIHPSLVATHQQSQPDGLLAGIRSFLTAPLGWIGLSSSGSANGKPNKQQKASNKRQSASVSPPSPPPLSRPSAPALSYRDLEPRHHTRYSQEPSRALPPPPPPASSAVTRSSAAKRYLPTSYSMNYLDAPVEDQPLPVSRSTRAAPSLSSTRHLSPAPAPAPAPLSRMTRSSTLAFPTAGRHGLSKDSSMDHDSLYDSSTPKSRLGGENRWMDRYSQRGEVSPAPEESLPRSNTLLSLPQPTQYRGMSRSSSVYSGLDQSRRSASIEPQSRQRTRTPGGGRSGLGQMVWEPDAGFMSQKTAELRAGPPPPPPSTNAAERILQALESMRSPLTEARRHLPTSATTSQLSDMPRSFSLGRIHIPTASKEQGAKDKETRRTDLMISPYGRGKVRRDLEKEKMGRTGGSRLRNMLSMAGKRNDRDESDSEGEESTDTENRRIKEEKRAAKSKGRKANNKRRQQSEDEAEIDQPRRYTTRQSVKKQIEAEESDSMMSDDSEEAPPSKPVKNTAPAVALGKPVDDFRRLPPNTNIDSNSRSRSSLRAKSTSSRKHVSAAGSRGQTPVESSSGRFSAREEDLPDDEDLGKIKFVMPAGGLNIPAVKKEPVSSDSLLSRLEAEKKDLAKKPANPFAAPAVPSPLGQGTNDASKPKDSVKEKEKETFSFGAPLPASSSTSAFAALASNPGSKTAPTGVPNFFASTLSKKTDTPLSKAAIESTPKKSFSSLGNGAPAFGSTTPQSTPPPSIPSFFAKPAAESAPAVQAPSNPFASSRPQGSTAPAPAPSASASAAPTSVASSIPSSSNPFAGVGTTDSKPVESKTTSSGLSKVDSATSFGAPSANPFGQSKPVASGLSVPSFSFGSAPKTSRKVSDGGMDMMDEAPEKASGDSVKAPTPAPAPIQKDAAAPSPFSFGAPAAKPVESSPFSFGSTPAAPPPAASAAPSAPAPSASSTGFSFGSTPVAAAPAASTTTASPFSFGASTATSEASKPAAPATASAATASPFSFGASSSNNSVPAAPKPFAFGASSDTPKPTAPAPSTSASTGFSFGAAPSSAPSSAPFSFGASASASAEPPKPAANPFGSSSTTAAPANPFGNAAAGPSNGFSFGQSTSASATTPAPGASNVGAAPSSSPFGGFGSTPGAAPTPAAPAPAAASSFTFGKPTQPSASPFGAGATSNSSPFGQSVSPAFGQAAPPPSSASPAFGQSAPASTSFTFGSTNPAPTAPASSPFAFGAPTNGSTNAGLPSSGGFSFGAPSNSAAPSANTGFGATAPASNPFGSAPPASTFTFGASASGPTASPFGAAPSGTTTPTGATFAFGAGPTGVATPPRFESPGPQSPAPGGAPALFSMGAGDAAPSPGRVGPGGRPIRPLARRGAKRT